MLVLKAMSAIEIYIGQLLQTGILSHSFSKCGGNISDYSESHFQIRQNAALGTLSE
jgi:hypothetical protein